jgi:hypothetical protein
MLPWSEGKAQEVPSTANLLDCPLEDLVRSISLQWLELTWQGRCQLPPAKTIF